MVAAIALLFAFQGFSRADDDHNSQADDDHEATAIPDCNTGISLPGRYFLDRDLKQCNGLSITASDVELDLRGHTIQGLGPLITNVLINISADGGTTSLHDIEIKGPGTLTGGGIGISFQNVHHSRVNNLVVAGNFDGVAVTESDQNDFIHNNLSGNSDIGLSLLTNGNNNIVRYNTVDSNVSIGILALGSGNIIDHNTALGNLGNSDDLQDDNGDCAHNTWTFNSFNFAFPGCIQ
jgi:parallel beta-helix repeat protein